jgi:hypothetical protein
MAGAEECRLTVINGPTKKPREAKPLNLIFASTRNLSTCKLMGNPLSKKMD